MITQRIAKAKVTARPPISDSVFSKTKKYLKNVLSKKRCVRCRWTGSQKCLHCQGKGMIRGEGWFVPGASAIYLEPCRRCIGTGKEDCHCCGGASALPPTSSPHFS